MQVCATMVKGIQICVFCSLCVHSGAYYSGNGALMLVSWYFKVEVATTVLLFCNGSFCLTTFSSIVDIVNFTPQIQYGTLIAYCEDHAPFLTHFWSSTMSNRGVVTIAANIVWSSSFLFNDDSSWRLMIPMTNIGWWMMVNDDCFDQR